MKELQAKRFIKKLFNSKAFSVSLFVIFCFLLNSVYGVYKKDKMARINTEDSRRNYASLETKKKELEKEISRLSSESGIEEEIRRRLQLLKSGERVLVIVDNEEKKEEEILIKKKWYEEMWEEFLGEVSF